MTKEDIVLIQEDTNYSKLFPYQKELLKDISKYRIINKARQTGISTLIALEALYDCLSNSNYTALFVSVSERQSQLLSEKVYNIIYSIKEKGKNIKLLESSKSVIKLSNGSQLVSLPNSPETIRGYTANHVYIDESAHFQNEKEVIAAVLPMISATKGRLTLVSTPFGKRGFFFDTWEKALMKKNSFSSHKIFWTERFTEEEIKGIKEEFGLDDISFMQEYCNEFIDESVSFFPYDMIMGCVQDYEEELEGAKNGFYFMGVDFGKRVDSTVISVIEKKDTVIRVVHIKEMRQIDYNTQLSYLKSLSNQFSAVKVFIDATGVGVKLEEDCRKDMGSKIEAITFTNQTKEKMITNLRILFQDKKIIIPRNDKLILQLHNLQRNVTVLGTVQYKHLEGQHDDYVWSLALACSDIMFEEAGIDSCFYEPSGFDYAKGVERIKEKEGVETITGEDRWL